MKLNEFFKNVFTYGASAEKWVNNFIGRKLGHTFVNDFAVADWSGGTKAVKQTLKSIHKTWGKDYKAMTDVVIALNNLAWFNDQLKRQGFEGRENYIDFYSDLYFEERDWFYKHFKDNEEAQSYFYEMTD